MLIVLGGVEEQEKVMSSCESWSDDEEYYMDSEEEQELMGCKLPEDQLRAALTALLHQRQGWQEEEGGATQQKPREKAGQVSGRLCLGVSGPDLERIFVSAPELERKMPSQRRHKSSEEEEEDDLAGYADDEPAHDQLPEQPTVADQKRCATDEVGSEGSEGRRTRMLFHDRHGKLWSNSEVVTASRIHVNEGETIAPIHEEYLTVMRDKGFVESRSWAHSHSLMVCRPCSEGLVVNETLIQQAGPNERRTSLPFSRSLGIAIPGASWMPEVRMRLGSNYVHIQTRSHVYQQNTLETDLLYRADF
jgi:hypothetical protein